MSREGGGGSRISGDLRGLAASCGRSGNHRLLYTSMQAPESSQERINPRDGSYRRNSNVAAMVLIFLPVFITVLLSGLVLADESSLQA